MQQPDHDLSNQSGTPPSSEPIAIIGIGCRFPGGIHDLDSFWKLLKDGVDAIGEIPASRFDASAFYDQIPYTPGKVITRQGGFITDRLDYFDAAFFGISPREATMMDPQQRLLLETAWEAFENAGLPYSRISGSLTGVYVGMWTNEYEDRIYHSSYDVDLYVTTGGGRYAASGRLSYVFDLQGPSLTLDTACSSSLVATHLACQSLRSGETDMALIGATNLILEPHISIGYSKSKMLSPDGRCKFGDASADGYVRSEGVGVLILKPLSKAISDGDPIQALILGSAMNNDGQGSGLLVAPSGQGQVEMLRNAYHEANTSPGMVGYIEAHGTGTPVGDPVELQALGEVLKDGRNPGEFCAVGSVKTNIGHTEAASGMAGLIKAVLCLQHRAIPPSLHFKNPNPRLNWEDMPMRIQGEYGAWPAHVKTLIAGVNSFGVTGTNAHIVLSEAPPVRASTYANYAERGLLPLSARSVDGLREVAKEFAEFLMNSDADLNDILYTTSQRRTHHAHRLVVRGTSKQELVDALSAYLQNDPLAPVTIGELDEQRKVVFVFPGQGSQWLGMGRQLYQSEPVFRKVIQACEEAFKPFVDWSLTEHLFASQGHPRLEDIDVVQPTLFAIEVALAELWRAWGVEPDAVVGHSMGEPAAAYISGVLSLEDAAHVICSRSRLMKRVSGKGAMAVVELTMDQAHAAIKGFEDRLSIAVSNGLRSTVLSGDPNALQSVTKHLQEQGVFVRFVKVDVAAHSPHMDSIKPELVDELANIKANLPKIPVYSTVTGGVVDFPLDADYWGRNLREPVLFSGAVEELTNNGYSIFIECSPHPILLAAIEPSKPMEKSSDQRITIPSMRRGEDELIAIKSGLARVHCEGGVVHWEQLYPEGRCIALPAYPWQRERFWAKEAELGRRGVSKITSNLLGEYFEPSSQPGVHIWQTDLSLEAFPYLADHRVDGAVLFPAAAFAEMALEAAATLQGKHSIGNLELLEALSLQPDQSLIMQLVLTANLNFEIRSREVGKSEWILHVRGVIRPQQDMALTKAKPIVQSQAEQSGDVHVAAMVKRGLDYGPAFRSIVSYSKSESTIQATICLPENSRVGEHVIHPSLLDACFQLLITTLDDTVAVGDAFLPVKIHSLMVSTLPVPNAIYRVVVTRYAAHTDDDLVGDIQMQNDLGQVVLAVERLEMKRFARNVRKLDELLYSIQWKASPDLPTPGQAAGRWLIATDGQDEAEALAASLRLLGAVCDIKLLADQALDRGLEDLRQDLLRSLTEPYRDVVFLATCQSARSPSVAEKYILRLLALVQALAQVDWQEPPRLRVVTVGAVSILKGDIVSPAFTALWGMVASIAHEFPEWRCSLVDLDSLADGSVLSRELTIDDQDPVGFGPVAWRGEQRFIAELIQHSPSDDRRSLNEPATPANGRPFRVVSTQPGVLETLALRAVQRSEPGSGQVEIAVFTTGLNFMNVLSALGTYPGYPAGSGPLGIECSGIISRIGPDVNGLRVGDAVMAVAFHSLGTHAITEASLVQLKPENMSFEQAATIPITFLTAYYALCHLGHMKRGERVLIHSAAGGVGLAAVQLAQHFGAEIFATAGNEEKRAYLHSLGIAHVLDSRKLDFADQIMTITDGQGVDLVLNSLSGEAIPRSLASLAPYGRFLEIGKRDIYENTQIGLLPFQKSLSYSAIDLDRMARERPELLGQLFAEVMELLRQGNIAPLPLTIFPVAQTVDAFHTMAQARHIGKIVISLEDKTDLNILPSLQDTARIKSDGTYLITGGLGALGLKVAGWLAEQGAQHIVLVGRSGLANLTPEAASTIKALEEQGVNLVVKSVDMADFTQVQLMIQSIQENLPPLRGILHAAGVLDDGVLTQQTEDRFNKVLSPKIYGAWNLHQLTLSLPLDFFILFSSVTAPFGSPGQSNYAAANAFIDGLAHFRHASGLAALSINWGPWSQIGLAAQRQQGGLQGLAGLSAITPDDGLRILGKLMDGDAAQVIATNLDAAEWQVHHPAAKISTLFAGLASQPDIQAVSTSTKGILANLLATEVGRPRRALLENFVQEQVAHVLRLPPERVDFHKPLRAMGMDSLMTIEFRNRLEGNLGLTLSASLVWNYPTINDIVPYLAEKAGIPLEMTPATSESKPSDGQLPEEVVSVALKSLSDDEVTDLLDDELSAIDDLLKKNNP